MNSSLWITSLLTNLATQLPTLLVQFVGLVLALVWWRRHPTVSLVFLGAVLLLIVTNLAGAFLFTWLPQELQANQGWSMNQISNLLSVMSFGRSVSAALGWSLLLYAVFGERSGLAKVVRPGDWGQS